MQPRVNASIRTALLLSLVFACSLSGRAQSELSADRRSSLALSPTIGSTSPLTMRVQEVNLTLSVAGHHMHFDPSLTTADLSILDNDQPPNRITYFERQTNVPVIIALVIDISNSVSYTFKRTQHAATDFVKNDLRSRDMALLIGFNQQPRVFQAPTGDYGLLQKAIKQLPNGG